MQMLRAVIYAKYAIEIKPVRRLKRVEYRLMVAGKFFFGSLFNVKLSSV